MKPASLLVLISAQAFLWGQQLPSGTIAGFDVQAIDKAVNPCENFYQYSCGTWLKNNPIPPDQSSWGRFSALAERNREVLHQILEKAQANQAGRSDTDQKIGDYYASCMDEAAIEKKGTQPLQGNIQRIQGMKSLAELMPVLAQLHKIGVNAFFQFGSGQDFKDSTKVIAQTDQGGLGLPERDYYFKTDPTSVETRQKYVAFVQKWFELLGDSSNVAAAKAKAVMKMETALAKDSQDVVTRRDPTKIYHLMSVVDLQKLTPSLNWNSYLKELGAPSVSSLNVAVPQFFSGIENLLKTANLDDIKTYLVWHYSEHEAEFLPSAFVNARFDFFGKTLTGSKELKTRWKRCVAFADGDLGEALGKAFVEKTFGPESKAKTLEMVNALEKAMGQDIEKLDWMTPATKQKAMEKLHAITNKIGYPEKWRDYSTVNIVRGDMIGNTDRATEFEVARQLNKIGKPVDRLEWGMTPPTVNAYYDPQMNNINFPAGILQPPFYEKSQDDAVNFGAIGAVIGHELTHGFDDEGRQFDPQGNLRDWWTGKDADAFDTREQCIIDEYSNFVAAGDVKLNGKLTLGENTADNGGLRIAYMALMNTLGNNIPGPRDGYTTQQRFFLGWGQIWCQNETEQLSRLQAQTNPHAIDKYRVNGVVSNMPEFRQAFGCKAGQPMVREKSCRVW